MATAGQEKSFCTFELVSLFRGLPPGGGIYAPTLSPLPRVQLPSLFRSPILYAFEVPVPLFLFRFCFSSSCFPVRFWTEKLLRSCQSFSASASSSSAALPLPFPILLLAFVLFHLLSCQIFTFADCLMSE